VEVRVLFGACAKAPRRRGFSFLRGASASWGRIFRGNALRQLAGI
jgi:hypothetical protein